MPLTSIQAPRRATPDTPEVEAAERKVAAVLEELEQATSGEVRKIGLDDLVDTDEQGRPVMKKAVDIELAHRPRRRWAR